MKKLISALLAVLLLAAPVLAADEPDTLAARFDALPDSLFRQKRP